MLGVSLQTWTLWSSTGRYTKYLSVLLFEAAPDNISKLICVFLSAINIIAENGQT